MKKILKERYWWPKLEQPKVVKCLKVHNVKIMVGK